MWSPSFSRNSFSHILTFEQSEWEGSRAILMVFLYAVWNGPRRAFCVARAVRVRKVESSGKHVVSCDGVERLPTSPFYVPSAKKKKHTISSCTKKNTTNDVRTSLVDDDAFECKGHAAVVVPTRVRVDAPKVHRQHEIVRREKTVYHNGTGMECKVSPGKECKIGREKMSLALRNRIKGTTSLDRLGCA